MNVDINKPTTKHRRKLNAEQTEVLELLYKFRFGSNDLFAQYFGKSSRAFVFKRLSILLEQGLIGKRYESSYRLAGKPAAYYLTPAGARALQERRDASKSALNIKAIYKDKTIKDDFVAQCLDIFAAFNRLRSQYGDGLKFFTRANLNYEQFDYFPQPLPHAYVCVQIDGEDKQYFLDFYYEKQPFFAAVKKIKQYIDYAEDGGWEETGTDLPIFLAICESDSLQKRLYKRATKMLGDSWDDDMKFALTTKREVLDGDSAIWQLSNESKINLKLEEL